MQKITTKIINIIIHFNHLNIFITPYYHIYMSFASNNQALILQILNKSAQKAR